MYHSFEREMKNTGTFLLRNIAIQHEGGLSNRHATDIYGDAFFVFVFNVLYWKYGKLELIPPVPGVVTADNNSYVLPVQYGARHETIGFSVRIVINAATK